jgi:hypothetical protein
MLKTKKVRLLVNFISVPVKVYSLKNNITEKIENSFDYYNNTEQD